MSMTRRLFLRHTAAAGAAVAVSVPAVAAAEPEQPWDKARRLARELSDTTVEPATPKSSRPEAAR
jgi:hypothetical protein